jgi:hypothetical protein
LPQFALVGHDGCSRRYGRRMVSSGSIHGRDAPPVGTCRLARLAGRDHMVAANGSHAVDFTTRLRPCVPEVKTVELDVPTAIRAQLVTLPDAERGATLARLELLAQDPDRLGTDVRKSRDDADLWTVRLSPRLRALVRADGNRLRVLAVASRDQLLPYLTPDGQRAA